MRSDDQLTWREPPTVPALLNSVPITFQRPALRLEVFTELGQCLPCKIVWEFEWAIKAVCLKKAAVLKQPMHHWRVDGQGHFTCESKAMSVAEAGVQIKQRLFSMRKKRVGPHSEGWFRSGLADEWFVLAFQLSRMPGRRVVAFHAWRHSIIVDLSWKKFRFLCRLIVGCPIRVSIGVDQAKS